MLPSAHLGGRQKRPHIGPSQPGTQAQPRGVGYCSSWKLPCPKGSIGGWGFGGLIPSPPLLRQLPLICQG